MSLDREEDGTNFADRPGGEPRAHASVLVSRLDSESRGRMRFSCIDELGKLSDPLATAKLTELVRGSSSEVERALAATGLADRESPEVIGLLLEVASRDPSPTVREKAIEALSRSKLDDRSSAGLERLAHAKHASDRAAVARALSGVQSSNAVGTLSELLNDPDLSVRVAAFHSMCIRAEPGMRPKLEATADGERWLVRRAMRRGIQGAYEDRTA